MCDEKLLELWNQQKFFIVRQYVQEVGHNRLITIAKVISVANRENALAEITESRDRKKTKDGIATAGCFPFVCFEKGALNDVLKMEKIGSILPYN